MLSHLLASIEYFYKLYRCWGWFFPSSFVFFFLQQQMKDGPIFVVGAQTGNNDILPIFCLHFCCFAIYITKAMSFLLGRLTFLPCHRELCMVKASMVTVKCFVWTWEKHFPPELYLQGKRTNLHLFFNISIHHPSKLT